MRKIKNFKRGFSIGEVVLSAFILASVLIVMIRTLAISLRDSMDSRDSIIATELAQEGVELVRNLRDNNWINLGGLVAGVGVTSFYNFPISSVSNCRIDKTAASIASLICDDSSSKLLNYQNGFYVHGNGTATKFRRKISLTYPAGQDRTNAATLTVNSMVVWNKSSDTFPATNAQCTVGNKCVYTELVLYRWNE